MRPPAVFSAVMRTATARLPAGSIEESRPLLTGPSLSSRIGSPAIILPRTTAPTMPARASGRVERLT